MEKILKIRNLTVKVEGKVILNDLDLDINKDQNLILFGPNGSGKSTLMGAIMGFENYEITSGTIEFSGKNIIGLSPDQRARLGVGVMFQHPPKIRGIQLKQFTDLLSHKSNNIQEKESLVKTLNLDYLLQRDLNVDLSGGEIKRSELFQVLVQRPKLLLLDEPESGVDLENIALMGKALNSYLQNHKVPALIISHTGYILDYIKTEYACVMLEGKVCCHDNPEKIFAEIKSVGYQRCKECQCRSGVKK